MAVARHTQKSQQTMRFMGAFGDTARFPRASILSIKREEWFGTHLYKSSPL